MREGAAPTMTISGSGDEGLTFELQGNMKDGYTNEIKPMPGSWGASHVPGFLWTGGRFKPLNIQLDLMVGVQKQEPRMKTPEGLSEIVRQLFLMTLIEKPGLQLPNRVTVSVGTWFERQGFIKNFDVEWMPPYDVETGLSHRVLVMFQLEADFNTAVSKDEGRSYKYIESRAPTSKNFNWKFTG